MKKFAFPLDRALAWQRLELDREKAALHALLGKCRAIETRQLAVRSQRCADEERIARALHVDAYEVATFPRWQYQTAKSLVALSAELKQMRGRGEQQALKVRDAERNVKLLERLRERRFAAWESARVREEEAFAAESYLARYIRLKRASPAGA